MTEQRSMAALGDGKGEGSSSTVQRTAGSSKGVAMDLKLDSSRSSASGVDSDASSASSTSRPASQLSTGRPSVKFASPRTLVVSFSDTARSHSLDTSANATPASTSAPSSSRLAVSPSPQSSSAHFDAELALQRREFEQRFVEFQQRVSAEQRHADCVSYRQQIAAMSEQLAVQELFMACQRVELAQFYLLRQQEEQQRLWEAQQAQDRARMEVERNGMQDDEQHSRLDSGASNSTADSTASDAVNSTSASIAASPTLHPPSRPATPSSALSSVSSVLEAAVSAPHQQHQHHSASSRPSAHHSVSASPFSIRPSSSSSSLSASRPASAALLSPRRTATAASSNYSAFTSPFVSSAARSASVLSSVSLAPYSSSVAHQFISSAASVGSVSSHSSPEPALADVLSMTESLLAQTDESLQAERSKCETLQSTIADMQRRAAATSRQYDADTAEIREQLRIRAAVCTRQEEALHRLTFENHSLVQQIIQLQHQLQSQQSQQQTHPARFAQPSSHHLPAANSTQQTVFARPAVGVREKSVSLFPPIPSASAASSVTVGRLSKSRFVQPPPAASLATGFHTDSSHASPISTAALGWSQGWKSYTSDNSGTSEVDESKEQLSMQWSMEQLNANSKGVARTPLLLYPSLPSHRIDSDTLEEDEQPQHLATLNGDEEVVVASSPLASTAPPHPESTAAVAESDEAPTSDLSVPPLIHVTTPILQPPAPALSPEQLHLHAQFHRPPLPAHESQPSRVPAVLRSRAAKSNAATAPLAAESLIVKATSFTAGPSSIAPAAHLEDEEGAAEQIRSKDGVRNEYTTAQQRGALALAAAPEDESEQGWIVETSGLG